MLYFYFKSSRECISIFTKFFSCNFSLSVANTFHAPSCAFKQMKAHIPKLKYLFSLVRSFLASGRINLQRHCGTLGFEWFKFVPWVSIPDFSFFLNKHPPKKRLAFWLALLNKLCNASVGNSHEWCEIKQTELLDIILAPVSDWQITGRKKCPLSTSVRLLPTDCVFTLNIWNPGVL